MKNYIPTIGLVAALAFAAATGNGQDSTPTPRPATPASPAVAVAVTVPAQEEAEALDATELALAAQEKALAQQNEELEKVNEKLWKLTPRAARATSTRSLVIPKDAVDVKNLTETEEDMSVMARILEKAANGKGPKLEHDAMGITVIGMSGSGAPRNLYIDGFGALFFLNVNFPLLPPATKEQTPESKSESDSDWKTAYDELYRPQNSGPDLSFNFTPFESGTYVYNSSGPAEKYDEDKVTELKENLTAALKNASHIRRLRGDDTVTVVVTGRNPGSSTRVTTRRSQNGSSSSSSSSSWSMTSRSGSQPPPARLIIRAKRSDVESFQKDKLSADDFRKKVTMFIY
jgi:hypothetical protein